MEARIKRRLNTRERATKLAREHPVNLPRADTLIGMIESIILELRQHAGDLAALISGAA